jgi:hypothetical protein
MVQNAWNLAYIHYHTSAYSSKTEENQYLRLNSEDIKRSSDFCYLGNVVAEDGRAIRDINVTVQMASGLFSKLRKVWLSTSIRKDTKIRIFKACVKSVLLYGYETWLVASDTGRRIQIFVNRRLRYIFRILSPKIIFNKELWKAKSQKYINLEIRKRTFRWIGHTLRKKEEEIPKALLQWNPQGSRKRGRQKIVGEDHLSKKRVEAGIN